MCAGLGCAAVSRGAVLSQALALCLRGPALAGLAGSFSAVQSPPLLNTRS